MDTTATTTQTHLSVTGMTCGSCVRHVDRALRDLEGVTKVEVQLRTGDVRAEHDARTTLDAMLAAVRAAGYDVRLAA